MTIDSCKCEVCVGCCKKRPCWATPDEVRKLVELGYEGRLMFDYWVGDGYDGGDINLISPAIVGCEGGDAPFVPLGRCTFLAEDDLCGLHDVCKPYEGRLSYHDGKTERNLHEEVAQMWNNPGSQALVDEVLQQWRG